MTVNKEQVLAALAKVPSPGGTALPDARVLSDVVVSEGKVFFSLTVDATAVKMWEPVRKAAEDAVRAIPGVQSALVALTAERSPQVPPPVRRNRPRRLRRVPRTPPTRFNRAFPVSTRSSQSPQGRAGSANRPPPSIWR